MRFFGLRRLTVAALITVVAVVLIFEVCCLVDIARAKEVRRLDRATWALICLVTLPLGGILYLSLGKKWKSGSGAVTRSLMWRSS
jgi:hypothetical protein